MAKIAKRIADNVNNKNNAQFSQHGESNPPSVSQKDISDTYQPLFDELAQTLDDLDKLIGAIDNGFKAVIATVPGGGPIGMAGAAAFLSQIQQVRSTLNQRKNNLEK